jgi:hypothetical protein
MIGIGMKRFAMRMYIALSLALAIDGAALAQTPSPNDARVKFMKPGETRTF